MPSTTCVMLFTKLEVLAVLAAQVDPEGRHRHLALDPLGVLVALQVSAATGQVLVRGPVTEQGSELGLAISLSTLVPARGQVLVQELVKEWGSELGLATSLWTLVLVTVCCRTRQLLWTRTGHNPRPSLLRLHSLPRCNTPGHNCNTCRPHTSP